MSECGRPVIRKPTSPDSFDSKQANPYIKGFAVGAIPAGSSVGRAADRVSAVRFRPGRQYYQRLGAAISAALFHFVQWRSQMVSSSFCAGEFLADVVPLEEYLRPVCVTMAAFDQATSRGALAILSITSAHFFRGLKVAPQVHQKPAKFRSISQVAVQC